MCHRSVGKSPKYAPGEAEGSSGAELEPAVWAGIPGLQPRESCVRGRKDSDSREAGSRDAQPPLGLAFHAPLSPQGHENLSGGGLRAAESHCTTGSQALQTGGWLRAGGEGKFQKPQGSHVERTRAAQRGPPGRVAQTEGQSEPR